MKELSEKISHWQLFLLIVMFETGTSIVVGVGKEAGQDSWIAIFLATIVALPIVWFYANLVLSKPGKDFYQVIEFVAGRFLMKPIAFLYVIYFFYCTCRVLRDFGELIAAAILPMTPMEVISICLMGVIAYIIYLGVEVLARTNEVFSTYVGFFLFLVVVFLLFGTDYQLNNIRPILATGLIPVIKAVFPTLLTFPFGETVAFCVVFSQVGRAEGVKKTSLAAVAVVGVLLMISNLIQIGILGVNIQSRSNFPLLSAAREISIANFIERIDALIVFIMMLGIIIKISVCFYAGLKGLEAVFNVHYRVFVIPMSTLVSLFSILIAQNFTEHIEEGLDFVPTYLHIPFQFVLPLLFFVIAFWKGRRKGEPDVVSKNANHSRS